MKRIAITINTSWNIYNFRFGLVKELQKQGYEVLAIAPKDEFSELLTKEGCLFIPIQMENKGSNPIKDLGIIKQLYKIYSAYRPEVILQFTIKPNIYGSIAAKLAGIPVINNVSGLGTVFLHKNLVSRLAKTLYRFAFRYPEKVFFQNPDDLALFVQRGLVRESIADLLPGSGVDVGKFYPRNKSSKDLPFTFLLIARLLYDKGIKEYAEAAEIVKRKGITAKFKLMGALDSSSLGIPENMLNDWVKREIIEYIPFQKDIRPVIAESDCIVLPSYREGTPKTLLEAAAMEKPLVATNVPGCKEVVMENENGFLCSAKNSESLSEALLKMLDLSDEERERLGRNSRNMVLLKYDERIVIQKYLETILGIIGRRDKANKE